MTIEEVTRPIADAPGKQCCLDPVSAWLLKQCKTELSPFLTQLFNSSFEAGKVALDMKTAINCTKTLKGEPQSIRTIKRLTRV